ncbi:hypothetical protein K7711_10385 [Nocardia sp. CA2R105]|uniref:hypothetical protein n=1 Tax=Nocardia coffeae TaxID=2873381 RepID=UPI001CA747E6|nr:hypothetical protein [Nocardia coffeae]MBY8856884.1 hypothetical protein [Nocardia coffeae]
MTPHNYIDDRDSVPLGICRNSERHSACRRSSLRENLILQLARCIRSYSLAWKSVPPLCSADHRNRQALSLNCAGRQMIAVDHVSIRKRFAALVNGLSLRPRLTVVGNIFRIIGYSLISQSNVSVAMSGRFAASGPEIVDMAYPVRRNETVFSGDTEELRGTEISARYLSLCAGVRGMRGAPYETF